MSQVTIRRHIYKAVSYRIVGTLQTMIIGYFFTGNVLIASSIGITEILVKPLIYFLHERVWYKWVKLGLKKTKTHGTNQIAGGASS